MPFTTDISQLIAQTRPRATGGGAHAQVVQMPPAISQKVGHGGLGESIGKGIGGYLDFMYNPKRVGERSEHVWKMLLDMKPDDRRFILERPEAQKQLQNFMKHDPVGKYRWFKDPELSGLIGPASSESIAAAQRLAKAEAGKAETQERKGKVEAGVAEETKDWTVEQALLDLQKSRSEAGLLAYTDEQLAELRKLGIDKVKSEVNALQKRTEKTEAETAGIKTQNQLAKETFDLVIQSMVSKNLLTDNQAQAALAASEASFAQAAETRALTSGKVEEQEVGIRYTEQQIKESKAREENYMEQIGIWRKKYNIERASEQVKELVSLRELEDKQLFEKEKWYGDNVPLGFAKEDIANTQSMVRSMRPVVTDFKLGDSNYGIPSALGEPSTAFWVSKSLYTAYNSFLGEMEGGFKDPKLGEIVKDATALFNTTYGALREVPAVHRQLLISDSEYYNLINCLGYMQYWTAEYFPSLFNMTKENKAQLRQDLENAGYTMTPPEIPGLWSQLFKSIKEHKALPES